ncbi:GNAT family N-acetyltransferase [Rhodococcus pseudokoreensis]|uniref:GNAT family N-acetyltransferase n=1 Tax=Rhodococcus pseudokoreensis TaxID=2811421 RepID=A0A974W6Y2_9NOCA|nr:GNAT family N-acetyltransferase [Rhodococcus pseudokoreensis]QSE92399.1 GNAT family N-acetyltransferase [Rhodococcus pseudokoreensis]
MPAAFEDTEPDLISLRSYDGPPSQGTAPLFRAARDADAEMGFSAPDQSFSGSSARYLTAEVRTLLHRWTTAAPSAPVLAAVVTARELGSSLWAVDIVVDPQFRSMGVATAVFETVGADLSGLPAPFGTTDGATFVGCSYGSHPASGRLARRFGAQFGGRRDRLLLPSRSDYAASRMARAPQPPFVVTADAGPDTGTPSVWRHFEEADATDTRLCITDADGSVAGHVRVGLTDEPHRAGLLRLDVDADSRDRSVGVVRTAIEHLWARGCVSIETSVDATDATTLDVLRSAAFQHDRSDALFILG